MPTSSRLQRHQALRYQCCHNTVRFDRADIFLVSKRFWKVYEVIWLNLNLIAEHVEDVVSLKWGMFHTSELAHWSLVRPIQCVAIWNNCTLIASADIKATSAN